MTKKAKGWNSFRPYQKGDLLEVAKDLPEQDAAELNALGFTDFAEIERQLLAEGARLRTWETEDGPVASFGVTPTKDKSVGLIWLLPTNAAHKRWRWGVRQTQKTIAELAEGYTVLTNFKDTRNKKQIQWLRRIGFTFLSTVEAPSGQTFTEFVRFTK